MTFPPPCEFSKVQQDPPDPFPCSRIRFVLTFYSQGIKAKVENKGQYDEYLRDLEPLREELGVDLKEDLYPEQVFTAGANTHG